ncbi:Autophagy-related protein 11 [Teratosphaeria destructans]|uniref:Autophagy-related protein 11 n=1 Tax=Teratosphaeria destructans TaxID=418781 RepID=A0A9W7W149_9PEZI|nr:Autophagy-related protein 11 [Teratosphaeria destructans]
MFTAVYVGHNGHRLQLDSSSVSTVDGLRKWIAHHAGIQPREQILLTSQGRQVRTQTLLTETELFVFDSARLHQTSPDPRSTSDSGSSTSNDFHPGTPPDAPASESTLQAWQNLFRLRKSWASGLLNGCDTRAKQARRYLDEQAVIERSLGVAVASLVQHVKSLAHKYEVAEELAEGLLADQHAHVENWDQHLDSLRSISARAEFARFMHAPSFVDVAATKKAASSAKAIMGTFSDRVGRIRIELEAITQETEQLRQAVREINARSTAQNNEEPAQLLEEIDLIAKKIATDFEHIQSLPRTSQSTEQALKMASLHSRNYIPQLSEHCTEMNELLRRTRHERNNLGDTAHQHMRMLSNIESQLSVLYADVKGIQTPPDEEQAFATLGVVTRLPAVYGQLLVESVRRREWVAKMRRDSTTLQEEVATYQEEEDKRRKKWIRSVEDVVNIEALQSNVLGIELSLRNEGGSWPMVTREELDEYLKTLLEVYGPGPVTDELCQAIKDLDKPTRKQIKYAKAFKNGSMHEAAFGDTSLLLRGDEQNKTLRDTNMRLEEELRAQKSRVRKLEDLLHRQSQNSRVSTGDIFAPHSGTISERNFSPTFSTPQPLEDNSRSSLNRRRLSSAAQNEEKKLARRVVDLEAELQAHRDEAAKRKNSEAETQKKVDDAISIKKDLMENMEAQQREFAIERRSLERELAEAKERAEEVENELDRLMGSRDDERTSVDARFGALQDENARLKEDAQGHAARAATEQDARTVLERKLELAEAGRARAEEELRQIQMEREQRNEAEVEQLQVLTTAYKHLSPDADPPDGLVVMAASLEELARRSAAYIKDLQEAVAFAKSENESLLVSNERQKAELTATHDVQAQSAEQCRRSEEALAAEQAKAQSLEQHLLQEQEQLRDLRNKFAEGETGSEVLRQRVAEEEIKAGKLTSELAEAKSHINSMDGELMRLQTQHKSYLSSIEDLNQQLEKRAERAREVSHKLYTYNIRLSRLLERLGLAISYLEDGSMIIERASKMGASTTMTDPAMSMQRIGFITSPPQTRKSSAAEEPLDLSLLRWTDAQNAEDEIAQYEIFAQYISRFNIDVFTEAVNKRLRDFEYTAKKYNKEAKESVKRADAYKERSVKLKAEANAKIAVKDFKEGDLALFLPTRGQAKGAWAAFNVGCPHYFLAEKEGMRLSNRDFIVARITRVEQKTVNLSRSLPSHTADGRSLDETASDAHSIEDDNPFELSDGLTWWMVHASEERGPGLGAPTTPGLGKSTVAAANVDATGSIRTKMNRKSDDASKHLNKSLDSRRSSSNSKRSVAGAIVGTIANAAGSPTTAHAADAGSLRQRSESQVSLRPPPQAPSAANGKEGLGIIADSDNNGDGPAQLRDRNGEQFRKTRTLSPGPSSSSATATAKARQRSQSPSKSIRSLQRHLEQPQQPPGRIKSPAASAKSPVKTPVKGKPWESLWQAEFTLESPSKGGDKA